MLGKFQKRIDSDISRGATPNDKDTRTNSISSPPGAKCKMSGKHVMQKLLACVIAKIFQFLTSMRCSILKFCPSREFQIENNEESNQITSLPPS